MSAALIHHRSEERAPIANGQWGLAQERRVGVMLHYDASSTDAGAESWFRHPECKVSYQWLVLDDGSRTRIAPDDVAAWHAGNCRPSEPRLRYSHANSAFYGIAAATNGVVGCTYLQVLTIAYLTARYFQMHGWDPTREAWRVTGHDREAWTRGRKIDPTGALDSHPILSVEGVRSLLPRFVLPRIQHLALAG